MTAAGLLVRLYDSPGAMGNAPAPATVRRNANTVRRAHPPGRRRERPRGGQPAEDCHDAKRPGYHNAYSLGLRGPTVRPTRPPWPRSPPPWTEPPPTVSRGRSPTPTRGQPIGLRPALPGGRGVDVDRPLRGRRPTRTGTPRPERSPRPTTSGRSAPTTPKASRGPWSSSGFFTAADAPAAPYDHRPANGATSLAADHGHLVHADPGRLPSPGPRRRRTVVDDTGATEDPVSRHGLRVPFPTNNTTRTVRVRVRDGGPVVGLVRDHRPGLLHKPRRPRPWPWPPRRPRSSSRWPTPPRSVPSRP